MSFIVKGIDLPKEDNIAFINVSCYDKYGNFICMADEIKPNRLVQISTEHGRLVDGKEILARAEQEVDGLIMTAEDLPIVIQWILDKCDTILEAEENQ